MLQLLTFTFSKGEHSASNQVRIRQRRLTVLVWIALDDIVDDDGDLEGEEKHCLPQQQQVNEAVFEPGMFMLRSYGVICEETLQANPVESSDKASILLITYPESHRKESSESKCDSISSRRTSLTLSSHG